MPAASQPTTPTGDEAGQEARENLKIQWELALFTGLLVFVGLLQVGTMFWQAWLLKGTKEKIQVQAGHMEDQNKILRDSVAVAKQNADTAIAQIEMVKSKERAQLRIEFDPLSLTYDPKSDGYPVRFKVILDGLTRATILYESIAAYLADAPGTKQMPWEPLGIGGTFRPDSSPFESVIFIQADGYFTENETDHDRVNLVRERKLDVYVTGRIRYRDLFGDEWELGIDRVWQQWGGWYGGDGKIAGVWTEAGNGKGDYHRKVEQPAKPN